MEKSIHVRGEIDKLELSGAPLVLPRSEYKVPGIRSAAGGLTIDTGKKNQGERRFFKSLSNGLIHPQAKQNGTGILPGRWTSLAMQCSVAAGRREYLKANS